MSNDTVTIADIKSLRVEAAQASDYAQVALCDRAINGSTRASMECERVIREARAKAAAS